MHLLYITGQTLTGAGGGGFVVLLTKEPNMADKVKAVIQENRVFNFYIDFFLISFICLTYIDPSKIDAMLQFGNPLKGNRRFFRR